MQLGHRFQEYVRQVVSQADLASFQDHEEAKYIAEINAYLSLKRRVEYGLYQYGKFLGHNLDVYI